MSLAVSFARPPSLWASLGASRLSLLLASNILDVAARVLGSRWCAYGTIATHVILLVLWLWRAYVELLLRRRGLFVIWIAFIAPSAFIRLHDPTSLPPALLLAAASVTSMVWLSLGDRLGRRWDAIHTSPTARRTPAGR